jgi:hypothetical protein
MKVKELIEQLKTYDADSIIELECTYDCGYGTVGGNVTDIYDRKLLDDVINTLNSKSNRELQDKIAMHGLASKAIFNGDKIITKRMMIDFCKKSK